MRSLPSGLALPLSIVLSLAACAEIVTPGGDTDLVAGVSVRVLGGALAPGASGTMRVENATASTALYGPCQVYFERWDGTRYLRSSPADRVCTEVLYAVPPGATEDRAFGLPVGAPPGTYRLAIEFTTTDGHALPPVHSNEFDMQ